MSPYVLPDRYTPYAPGPMDQHLRRRSNGIGGSLASRKEILHQLSSSISFQESRVSTLMRSFDIDLDGIDVGRRVDHSEGVESKDCSNPFIWPRLSRPSQSSPNTLRQPNTSSVQPLPSQPRLGRLSPTIIRMILAPNSSDLSEASSGADTSYDSGLYQWLGLKGPTPASHPSSSSELIYEKLSNTSYPDPNVSNVSSRSAYSQSSPLHSPSNKIFLPLSPPATVRPPFSESLFNDDTEPSVQSELGILTRPSVRRSRSFSEKTGDGDDPTFLHDLAMPMLFKNISLQHYMPSAIILRHFQRVIDELREKYVPNDMGNNPPIRKKNSNLSISATMVPLRSLSGSPSTPSTPFSPLDQPYDALEFGTQSAQAPKITENSSRATRELYIEMATMLFGQAEEEQAQIDGLRRLADRFEITARRKRQMALIFGAKGIGRAYMA